MKKQLFFILLAMLFCGSMNAQDDPSNETGEHYYQVTSGFQSNMNLRAKVCIDGIEQQSVNVIEIGAFNGSVVTASNFVRTFTSNNYYRVLLTIGGDNASYPITFKMYNHESGKEYVDYTITDPDGNPCEVINWANDASLGSWASPYVLNFLTPKHTKTISPYAGNGGWYLIASPIGNVAPEDVENMTSNNFDLYRFNQSESLEWENYKDNTHGHYHYALESGKGYLYANNGNNTGDVQLTFTGFPYNGDGKVTLVKDASAPNFSGWNLVGNPFAQDAYITKAFYIMNETRTGLCVGTGNKIGPMEGIFVEAETNGEEMIFSTTASGKTDGQLIVNLTGGHRGGVIDRAIVRFDNSEELHKFQLFEGNAMLYIPQNGQDFAMVNADQQGELPLHFKAAKNGTYTLSFNTEGLTMNYLHLIDNLTGNDVDLLATPSYTFEASITNYASRFKLVFATSNTSDDNFAFISNGKLIVNGTGTLQVFDVLGHELIVKQLSVFHFTSHSVGEPFGVPLSASLFSPGVYVLRLVNGNDIKTQKIIVK